VSSEEVADPLSNEGGLFVMHRVAGMVHEQYLATRQRPFHRYYLIDVREGIVLAGDQEDRYCAIGKVRLRPRGLVVVHGNHLVQELTPVARVVRAVVALREDVGCRRLFCDQVVRLQSSDSSGRRGVDAEVRADEGSSSYQVRTCQATPESSYATVAYAPEVRGCNRWRPRSGPGSDGR
jgi:hypothetical protein